MLKDKVILITGATGGMGQALCRSLAQMGAKLVLSSTREEELTTLCSQLRDQYHCAVTGAVLDATDEEQVAQFMERAHSEYPAFDALVNLSGVSIPGKIAETEETVFDQMMDVNLKAVYLMSKHFVSHAAKDARIINIGSMAARRTNGNAPLYCTAKAALNTFSQGLALQLASQGIHVTTLNPGGADTPFWGDRPVKRDKMLQAQDVVDVILFVLDSNPRIAIHSIDFESIHMVG